MRAARVTVRRWALPLGLVLAQFGLGLVARARGAPVPVWLLVGGPLGTLLLLFVLRWLDRSPHRRSREGDALVSWFLAMCFCGHTLALSVHTAVVASLHPYASVLVGAGLLGFSPLVATLPFGSPFGFVTGSTLGSPDRWRQVHQDLGVGAAVGAASCLLGAFLFERWWAISGMLPVLLAAALGLARRPRVVPDPAATEDPEAARLDRDGPDRYPHQRG